MRVALRHGYLFVAEPRLNVQQTGAHLYQSRRAGVTQYVRRVRRWLIVTADCHIEPTIGLSGYGPRKELNDAPGTLIARGARGSFRRATRTVPRWGRLRGSYILIGTHILFAQIISAPGQGREGEHGGRYGVGKLTATSTTLSYTYR